MSPRTRSEGVCAFCGQVYASSGMSRHLAACPERQEAIEAAAAGKGSPRPLLHLRVRDKYSPGFWLHLEMNGHSALETLDSYLRAIWLECCGHLSHFSVGSWGGQEIANRTWAEDAFLSARELTHLYDYGTTSETLISLVGVRQGRPLTRHPIYLMARNKMPALRCMECDQPATWFCQECQIEYGKSGWLCDEHVKEHPHENYGEPMPLANSPRVGMCAYCGPADPPY